MDAGCYQESKDMAKRLSTPSPDLIELTFPTCYPQNSWERYSGSKESNCKFHLLHANPFSYAPVITDEMSTMAYLRRNPIDSSDFIVMPTLATTCIPIGKYVL
ncbi:hypothetical protein ZIOFF_013845 [Zingiber officinale]|uniref:Uncharacterized protein n=1 Tax=Zingiber officinale TaxID=94328 RepID=A0A8J5HZZ2_ZINOF|nr:hypothetical protein ZIOFF_013845 [Zingiber officinale]